jgi:hypothetical protein
MNPPNDDWMKEGQNMPFWLSEMVFWPCIVVAHDAEAGNMHSKA